MKEKKSWYEKPCQHSAAKKKEMKSPSTGEKLWGAINPITLIDSNLNLKSGDQAVVGVSRLNISSSPDVNNKGFILIISGKIAS
jgi:hypothetical protein